MRSALRAHFYGEVTVCSVLALRFIRRIWTAQLTPSESFAWMRFAYAGNPAAYRAVMASSREEIDGVKARDTAPPVPEVETRAETEEG